ncbi:hypothetical protein BDA96_05G204800 [Sorghum bicolor]|uniref:DUF4220 domain-containing protein n=1 Tax=Sorghum bicolor TaxID=4558 RepID=A0A921R107_SORBI|nr:hypothetical protein BDA96_05G204800 [Sorghum bicolor]
MGSSSAAAVAGTIFSAMKRLFKLDKVTGGASVELWVVMTAVLLVIRFLIESSGAQVYTSRFTTATVQILAMLNYNMVHYTIGQMQLSAARVNDYFQVWAVLLATLQCSVNVGRPYSRSKQIPLLDIMSSFWAGNLLRVQTASDLKIPLWLIWALNAARVLSYFFSSDKADEENQGNTRLVTDYMRYEHTLSVAVSAGNGNASSSSSTLCIMCGYNYLVHGEDKLSRQILQQERKVGSGSSSYRVRLSPRDNKDLITVEKIWVVGGDGGESGLLGKTGDAKNRLKDACLSFALHKLLRRRFYDLPIHEDTVVAARDKKRRLVFDYILENTDNYERAFRVTEAELSFLRDTFYNRHAAAIFAGGFPYLRTILSLSLILSMGYIAYPVRHVPQRIDPNDKNRIIHGVFVTRLFIAIIIAKELWEICIYVFAPWTKVQMICMYIQHQCLRRPRVDKFWGLLLSLMPTPTGKWKRQIRQYNLLISARNVWKNSSTLKLRAEVQKAIFDTFKLLQQQDEQQRLELDNYLENAFGSNQHLCSNLEEWTRGLEADTHRILLWHIATGLCEIKLTDDARQRPVYWMRSKPLVKESKLSRDLWGNYITAVSISNYCAYLLTQRMVPENGLVADRVFNEVRRETKRAIFLQDRHVSLQTIYDKLVQLAAAEDETPRPAAEGEARRVEENQQQDDGAVGIAAEEQGFQAGDVIDQDPEEGNNGGDFTVGNEEPHNEEPNNGEPNGDNDGFDNTIIKMASKLGVQLIEAYKDEDQERLWRDLAKFWTGFLLHLAASTRAAKHKTHLPKNGELITHLWALLSHAGYVGNVGHGFQLLDPEDLNDVDPLS